MEILDNLLLGLSVASAPINLFYCLLGVLLGTFIGVLPGVGPLVTIAVLLPLTFGLTPEASLIMLAGIYYGAAYGGSTTAILVNIPGETSSVVTCLDGHQMARQGRAGPALAIAAISSFIAGCFGTVLIAAFAPPLTQLALRFGPPEYFSMILMALVLTAALSQGSIWKSTAMALTGVLFGLIGTDATSGTRRFTFGSPELADGLDFVVVAMGLFAIADIVNNLVRKDSSDGVVAPIGRLMPSRQDVRDSAGPVVRGSLIGSLLGVLPGAGQSIASFTSYAIESRFNRKRHLLGTGFAGGVASPEAANNAAAQTAFIPTLTLGLPGSATMALMLGALMIQGIAPGPRVISDHPSLFWGLVVSMWLGNMALVVLNLPMVGLWVKMLRIPYKWLYPAILMFSCIGVYSVGNSSFNVLMAAVFGLLGYAFLKMRCEPAPFVLGFVLGPMIEDNFRRALLLSRGDFALFVTEPISAGFLAVTALALVAMIWPSVRRAKEEAVVE
jgi:putative tricarboxylic transport membrane protein